MPGRQSLSQCSCSTKHAVSSKRNSKPCVDLALNAFFWGVVEGEICSWTSRKLPLPQPCCPNRGSWTPSASTPQSWTFMEGAPSVGWWKRRRFTPRGTSPGRLIIYAFFKLTFFKNLLSIHLEESWVLPREREKKSASYITAPCNSALAPNVHIGSLVASADTQMCTWGLLPTSPLSFCIGLYSLRAFSICHNSWSYLCGRLKPFW